MSEQSEADVVRDQIRGVLKHFKELEGEARRDAMDYRNSGTRVALDDAHALDMSADAYERAAMILASILPKAVSDE